MHAATLVAYQYWGEQVAKFIESVNICIEGLSILGGKCENCGGEFSPCS